MSRQKHTIKDVARLAGCGIATVSRVLNGTGPASAETRAAVMTAARTLGFEFNELGRALQRQRTMTIGCVVPSLANPVFAEALQGVQTRLRAAGYQLVVTSSDYETDLETEAITTLIAKQVDALLLTVTDPATSPGLAEVRARGVPFCLLFNLPDEALPAFAVDNRAASALAALAFARMGHQRTGFLALRFRSSDRSRQRFEGFRAACLAAGLAEPELLEVGEAEADIAAGLADLLGRHAGLTGIHASNDLLALAAMRAARGLGRRVPRDLSIIGFDGIDIGTLIEPTLATIVTHPRAMGEAAADHLLAELSGRHQAPAQGSLDPEADAPGQGTSGQETSGQGDPGAFEFRPGGSLGPAPPVTADDGKVAAFPPSQHSNPPAPKHDGKERS